MYHDVDLVTYIIIVMGVVMLSPSSDLISVCNGDQLQVTCSTTETFLRWNITLAHDQNEASNAINSFTRTVSWLSVTSLVSPVVTNSVMIGLHRSSAKDELPLVSSLTISSVSAIFNHTLLTCTELTSSAESATTLVHIPENVTRK